MVVLVPPSGAVGLVKVSGLLSAGGKGMNGKCGLIRGMNGRGRFVVEILGWRTNNSMYAADPGPCVDLKPINVKLLEENEFASYGCPLFEK